MTVSASTKDRLVLSAANLFRRKGYAGTGIAEILADAKAPKGSLYHHFPNGKPDLAIAAAHWASEQMRLVIAESYDPAESFEHGTKTLCYKLARLFELTDKQDGCPINGILIANPDLPEFTDHAGTHYETWLTDVTDHAIRLGIPPVAARVRAEHLFLLLQGGWTLARARRDASVLRALPDLL